MVAIYRSGYGYIDVANGMEISGIEDEFRYAQEHGIHTLAYVHRSDEGRDPRLAAMIEEMHSPLKLHFYSSPEELHGHVRDDLTAVITEQCLNAGAQRAVLDETAANVLARTLVRAKVVVPRTALIEKLNDRSRASPILCLYGPAGIGKTTLAAQFAQTNGAVFVRVAGLAPKDLFAVCAGALYGSTSAEAETYATLEGARLGLAAAWANTRQVTLVVDECNFIHELVEALSDGGGVSADKRLIFTSRESLAPFTGFVVPPLARPEAEQLVAMSDSSSQIPHHLIDEGNPLQLQQALSRVELDPGAVGLTRITGTAGEVIRYLALSSVALSAEDLLGLIDRDDYSIEELNTDVQRLGRLVDDSPRGLRIMHAETASLIASELRESPQRHRFYVNRLIRLFQNKGDLRQVYQLASLMNDGSEKQYAAATAREAARLGDWRLGVRLIDQLLTQALDAESKSEAFHLMLSLVYPLELMGDAQRAATLLDRARPLADALGPIAQSMFEEVETGSNARRNLSVESVETLRAIYQRYGDQQRNWDQARIGLELSAIYMAAKEFEKARDILRPTLATFAELGDDYGLDLAQRNLASTLSGLPGHEEEAEHLIRVIEDRSQGEPDARRQRAWMCNILTRRLRHAGRYGEAETLAKEAIDIGTVLGDENLRAINFINLGNVFRDQDRPKLAIEAYQAAVVAAQRCGRRDVEGDSSRMIAGILNDFTEIEGYDGRQARARFYAQHAIGLLQGSLNYDGLAWSLLELADAQEALGESAQAAQALFEAAKVFSQVPDEESFRRALVRGAMLALPDHVELYLQHLADALGVDRPAPGEALADRFIALVGALIERVPRGALIRLLGGHLHEVWSHLPEVMRGALVAAVVNVVGELARDRRNRSESWRVLYSGIVLSYLLKDMTHPFLHHRLVLSTMLNVEDVFVREEGNGSRTWTVVLNLGRRVTVSIVPLDETPETNLASFALAMFIKGFEVELGRELIGGGSAVDELTIFICHIDHLPEDMRRLGDQNLRLTEELAGQPCVVSRPTHFEQAAPTVVFLSPTFLDAIAFGEGRGGSLQMLFGLTLVEVTFQLLRGQVEMEAIRPKVISLVGRTLS